MSRTQGPLYRELPSTDGVCAASPWLLADRQELSVNKDCRGDSSRGGEEQSERKLILTASSSYARHSIKCSISMISFNSSGSFSAGGDEVSS